MIRFATTILALFCFLYTSFLFAEPQRQQGYLYEELEVTKVQSVLLSDGRTKITGEVRGRGYARLFLLLQLRGQPDDFRPMGGVPLPRGHSEFTFLVHLPSSPGLQWKIRALKDPAS